MHARKGVATRQAATLTHERGGIGEQPSQQQQQQQLQQHLQQQQQNHPTGTAITNLLSSSQNQHQHLPNKTHRSSTTNSRKNNDNYGKLDKQLHPRARPFRAVLAVTACIVICVGLFQMDVFHEHHKHRPLQKNTIPRHYVAPDRLMLGKPDAANLRGAAGGEGGKALSSLDSSESQKKKPEEHPLQNQQQQQPPPPENNDNTDNLTAHRRVAFELRNLKDGKDGTIVVEIIPEWAPLGAAHFWTLIEHNFYNQARFFRVVPKFVAQFGIAADPAVHEAFRTDVIRDDPVLQSNQRGTLTYAMSGPNTRSTQFFFNLKDNAYLDKEGFAPIGKIVQGEELLDEIVQEYGEKPVQGKIVRQGNAYLEADFPHLSYIETARKIVRGFSSDPNKLEMVHVPA